MRYAKHCLILSCLVFGAACTETTPEFDLLDADAIPKPLFNGSSVKTITTNNAAATHAIEGECDKKIKSINGTAVGGSATLSSLDSLSASGINVTCSTDGKFSFQLKSLSDLGYTPTEGQSYEVQLVGVTSAGLSGPSTIRITYTKSAAKIPTLLTSASNTVSDSGSGLKAEIRFSTRMNKYTAPADPAGMTEKTGAGGLRATVGVRVKY